MKKIANFFVLSFALTYELQQRVTLLYVPFRITPVYFYVILIDMTVFYDIGSGPFWNTFAAGLKESCRNYWWANVLYINDYYNGGGAVSSSVNKYF